MSKIAVLLPCYNEEITLGKVIDDVKKYLPDADIFVFNNNSTDRSKEIALEKKVNVIDVIEQGKGNVVKAMFKTIDADAYLMVDADDTYDLANASKMIDMILNEGYDMVIGDRLSSNYYQNNKIMFHSFGNRLVKFLVNVMYHNKISDIMTGLRTFSPRFVKEMNIISKGFEIETEMSIYATKKKMKVGAVLVDYRDRPEGSYTKTKAIRDGLKIIKLIFKKKFSK